jgi:hypothetical protein
LLYSSRTCGLNAAHKSPLCSGACASRFCQLIQLSKSLRIPGIPGTPHSRRDVQLRTENKKPGAERRANSSHLDEFARCSAHVNPCIRSRPRFQT